MIDSGTDPASPGAGGSRPDYFPAVDGLRAVAVLLVLIYHLRPERLPGGLLGVDIFFVISGFVVTSSLARCSFPTLGSLLSYFYARRARRVVPALLVTLIVTTLLADLFMPWMWRAVRPAAMPSAIAAALGLSNLLFVAQGDFYTNATTQHMPFFHTWSLGVEEQFYLVFPFLYAVWRRTRRPAIAGGGVAILTGLSFLLYDRLAITSPILAFYLMPARFWELGTGMLLWLGRDTWLPLLARLPRWSVEAASIVGLALLAVGALRHGAAGSVAVHLAIVAASAILVVLSASERRFLAGRALSSAPFVMTGLISYSLYLWHVPIFVLFKWTIGLQGAVAAAAALLVTLAAATFSYRFVEQPFRRRRASGARPNARVLIVVASAVAAAVGSIAWLASETTPFTLSRDPLLARAAIAVAPLPCERSAERLVSTGSVIDWSPTCRPPAGPMRLVVLGDSHAQAYDEILRRYASEAGIPVRLYWKGGCEFPPIAMPAAQRKHCLGWEKVVLDELSGELRKSDVVFLPSMHLRRFGGIWGAEDLPPSAATAEESASAALEARSLLKPLLGKAGRIIIEAPEPVFHSAPFRCGDWFNRTNPACAAGFTMPRREEMRLRAPALDTIEKLAADLPGVAVFDPFPILCPGDPCSAYAGGKPIYWDDNHVSRFGMDLLYPAFQHAVAAPAADRMPTRR